MKKIVRLLHYLHVAVRTIRVCRNWPKMLLLYLPIGPDNIVVKLRNGLNLKIRNNRMDSWIIRELFADKIYHDDIAKLGKDAVVIDIGANIGAFSVLAAKQNISITVFCYEPFQDNFSLLQDNIILNDFEKRIHSYNCAVAADTGERVVFVKSGSDAQSSMYDTHGNKVKIKTVSLSSIFEQNNIDICNLLKIDCEGAEYEILYSAPTEIFNKIKRINLEYHEDFGTGKGVEIKKFLEERGYHVVINWEKETRGGISAKKP